MSDYSFTWVRTKRPVYIRESKTLDEILESYRAAFPDLKGKGIEGVVIRSITAAPEEITTEDRWRLLVTAYFDLGMRGEIMNHFQEIYSKKSAEVKKNARKKI